MGSDDDVGASPRRLSCRSPRSQQRSAQDYTRDGEIDGPSKYKQAIRRFCPRQGMDSRPFRHRSCARHGGPVPAERLLKRGEILLST